jgi:hypothetical protein
MTLREDETAILKAAEYLQDAVGCIKGVGKPMQMFLAAMLVEEGLSSFDDVCAMATVIEDWIDGHQKAREMEGGHA